MSDVTRLIQVLRERWAPTPGMSIEEQRIRFEAAVRKVPLSAGVERKSAGIRHLNGEWSCPLDVDPVCAPTVLHLHGGGYVMGSLATVRPLVSYLAAAAEARVLTVDYRLAPEHPHPAAVEDAVCAYEWLLDQGREPSRITVSGDSAGAGLAVATLVALRDRGYRLPAAGVCLSPWTDLTLSRCADGGSKSDPQVPCWLLRDMANRYLSGQDPRTPLASPVFADLSGLPPFLVQVGTLETLLPDAIAFATAGIDAGVEIQLERWPGMFHVWHAFAPYLSEAIEALCQVGLWIRSHVSMST